MLKLTNTTIGRGGFIDPTDKTEGDGCTPLGTYPLREVWYRPDRVERPTSGLPVREITREDGWCDESGHVWYNKHFRLRPKSSPPLGGGARGGAVAKRYYPENNTLLAKQLRKNATDAEKKLWYRIRSKQIHGVKFRRQQPIGPYIADFVCQSHKLIIELDGGQHNEDAHKKADDHRDTFFKEEGYHVLRFWNHEVFKNMDGVLESIALTLNSLNTRENPSSDLLSIPLTPLSLRKRNTNQILLLPQGEEKYLSYEHLWREDGAYDLIVVIGYNDDPPIPKKGSAIFIHCTHDDGRPTAGCVALEKDYLLEVIAKLHTDAMIEITSNKINII